MVRHLEHVDVQPRKGPSQRGLSRRLHVTGQQDPQPAHLGEQDDARVVGGRPVAGAFLDRPRAGPEHLEGDCAVRRRGGVRRRAGVQPLGAAQLGHLGDATGWVQHAGGQHRPDLAAVDDPGEPVDVISVEVGQHHHGHLPHPEASKAVVHERRVRPGIDHHAGPGTGADHQGIALADVAHRQHPPLRRPPRRRPAHHDDRRQHRRGDDRRDRSAQHGRRGHGDQDRQRGEQGQCNDPGPPPDSGRRQVRAPPGDHCDPRDTPAGACAEQPPQRREQQTDEPAGQAENGRRPHHRRDREVGRHRDQAHLSGDGGHHGRAGELGGSGHRDRLGQPPWQPASQGVAPARREQHDAGRGQHRQREANRHGQARLRQQQDDHRDPEPAQRSVPSVEAHRQQPHRAHDRRAQHAGLGAGDQHEAGDPDRADEVQPPTPHPAPPGHDQEEADDQGEVGAGHGGQVREPGRPEVLLQALRQRRIVAVDKRRHQRALLDRPTRHGVTDRLPHRPSRPPPDVGTGDHVRVAGHDEDPGEVVIIGRAQPTRRAHLGAQGYVEPGPAADHEHRRAEAPRGAAPGDRADVQPQHHPLVETALDRPRVGDHPTRHAHHRALLGQPRHRRGMHRLRPQPGGAGHGAADEQYGCHRRQNGSPTPAQRDARQDQRGHARGQGPASRALVCDQRAHPRRQPEERHPQVRRGLRHQCRESGVVMRLACSGCVHRKAAERRHAGRTSSDANAARCVPWAREARKDS